MYVLLRGPLGICSNTRMLGAKFDKPFATYDRENKQMNLIINQNADIQNQTAILIDSESKANEKKIAIDSLTIQV